jgi:hypothetical protein
VALQPLYKGLGKAEFEGGEVKKEEKPLLAYSTK